MIGQVVWKVNQVITAQCLKGRERDGGNIWPFTQRCREHSLLSYVSAGTNFRASVELRERLVRAYSRGAHRMLDLYLIVTCKLQILDAVVYAHGVQILCRRSVCTVYSCGLLNFSRAGLHRMFRCKVTISYLTAD